MKLTGAARLNPRVERTKIDPVVATEQAGSLLVSATVTLMRQTQLHPRQQHIISSQRLPTTSWVLNWKIQSKTTVLIAMPIRLLLALVTTAAMVNRISKSSPGFNFVHFGELRSCSLQSPPGIIPSVDCHEVFNTDLPPRRSLLLMYIYQPDLQPRVLVTVVLIALLPLHDCFAGAWIICTITYQTSHKST